MFRRKLESLTLSIYLNIKRQKVRTNLLPSSPIEICRIRLFLGKMPHLSAICGEETSPTPQTDWSLAHGFKTAFGLKSLWNLRFYSVFSRIIRFCFFRRSGAFQRTLYEATTVPIPGAHTQAGLVFFAGQFPESGINFYLIACLSVI